VPGGIPNFRQRPPAGQGVAQERMPSVVNCQRGKLRRARRTTVPFAGLSEIFSRPDFRRLVQGLCMVCAQSVADRRVELVAAAHQTASAQALAERPYDRLGTPPRAYVQDSISLCVRAAVRPTFRSRSKSSPR
jgi:hypothetical protein